MRHPVRPQHRKILRMQKTPVPNLHPIPPPARQPPQKPVQFPHKIPPPRKIPGMKRRKLEHQHPHPFPDRLARPQKRLRKQPRIKKPTVLLPPSLAIPRQSRKPLHRDLTRHLEREPESLRHLHRQRLQSLPRRKTIVRRIHTHRPEHRRILPQTLPLELRLRKPPSHPIPIRFINHPQPPGILPRRRPHIHPSLRRQFHLRPQLIRQRRKQSHLVSLSNPPHRGRCSPQYSSPSAATRNSSSGFAPSVRPHTLHR